MVKLKAPAILGNLARTICLPTANEDLDTGTQCVVSGKFSFVEEATEAFFDVIICDALHHLVSFVQFKKHEKHPWRSVNFSKVVG